MIKNNMKKYIYSKVGYSTGQYGCSSEYFNFIVIDGDTIKGFVVSGMYGAEERVGGELERRGFERFYIPLNVYGKLPNKDGKWAYSEYIAIENMDELLTHGYIELNKEYRKKAGLDAIKK